MKRIIISLVLIFSCDYLHSGAGSNSADFLKLGVGARPSGMGDAFVAVSDDANSIYWNPSGLAKLRKNEITLMHLNFPENIYFYEYLGFVYPTDFIGVFGLGVNFGTTGNIPNVSELDSGDIGDETGYYRNDDLAINLSWATKLYKTGFLIGTNVKFINQRVATTSVYGVAIDLGVYRDFQLFYEDFSFGLNIQNIGTSIKENALPTNFKFGIANKQSLFANYDLLVSTEANYTLVDKQFYYQLGAEYFYDFIGIRIGYKFNYDAGNYTSGISILDLIPYIDSLDYAFIPLGDIGYSHKISLTIQFGEEIFRAKSDEKSYRKSRKKSKY